jgi:TPR repeat protein
LTRDERLCSNPQMRILASIISGALAILLGCTNSPPAASPAPPTESPASHSETPFTEPAAASPEEQLAIAKQYLNVDGNREREYDPEEAMVWLERAAEGGNAEAQYGYAVHYCAGSDVVQDIGKCIDWLVRSADQSFDPAWETLQRLLGSARDPDAEHALEVLAALREAADRGRVSAQLAMAVARFREIGEAEDGEGALRWLELAVAQDMPRARLIYGGVLLEGPRVEADLQAGRQQIELAAEAGLYDAFKLLILSHARGHYGFTADMERAEFWARRGVELGVQGTLTLLADVHYTGAAGAADPVGGAALLHEAAALGDFDAELALAQAYLVESQRIRVIPVLRPCSATYTSWVRVCREIWRPPSTGTANPQIRGTPWPCSDWRTCTSRVGAFRLITAAPSSTSRWPLRPVTPMLSTGWRSSIAEATADRTRECSNGSG